MYLINKEEGKEIDKYLIENFKIPSMVLMERAALAATNVIKDHISDDDKILIICGSGNNGGDGVCIGRMLEHLGYNVTLTIIGKETSYSSELKNQIEIAKKLELNFNDAPIFSEYNVIVDGIFGIGLSREVEGHYKEWINKINDFCGKVFSIDIPSGIDASTGKVFNVAVKADYTITFGEQKLGNVLVPGKLYAGEVYVEDIGFPKESVLKVNCKCYSYDREDYIKLFPKRVAMSNKGTYGNVLVIAGCKDIGGAALFATKACYLMGAGIVKIITHENNRYMLQNAVPEALIKVYSDEIDIEADIEKATAIVIGPGLGKSDNAREVLKRVLKVRDKKVLIDADGINILASMDEYFDENRILLLPNNFILTPHLKELSRLFKCSIDDIKDDIIDFVVSHTKGAVIVAKDSTTVVSDGDKIYINQSGNNALAKGGSGDVLSGIIGGLLARNMSPLIASGLGVYLHGLTAEEYVKNKSSSSMLATDILQILPSILP